MADDNVRHLRSGVDAIVAMLNVTAFGGDSGRPFHGQPWTWAGERGVKPVPEMRYRDLADVIVRALRDFPFHRGDPDRDAIAQCVLKQLEDETKDPK